MDSTQPNLLLGHLAWFFGIFFLALLLIIKWKAIFFLIKNRKEFLVYLNIKKYALVSFFLSFIAECFLLFKLYVWSK